MPSRPAPPAGVVDYPWERLPSLSGRDVETTNRLLGLLPLDTDRGTTLSALGDNLSEIAGFPHAIEFHGLRVHDPNRPPPTFGDAFATRFHLPPDPETGALLLEMSLVDRWLTDLRGEGRDIQRAGDVDHRDFGLATYVVVRAFDWLTAECGAPPVVFPCEPPLREGLRERLDAADRLVEVTYIVATDRNRHLARLLIPEGFVRNSEVFHRGEASRRTVASRLLDGPLADLDIELPVAIGRTSLDRRAYPRLKAGDIVVFDEHGYATDEERREPTSPAARLELGGGAHLRGHLLAGPSHWQFRPTDSTPRREEPDAVSETTHAPDDETAAGEPDPGPTELLETPEVRLEARLGSTALTLRQLARMEPGQVITLDRRVGEPVELVVDDRVVGEGELVEVEGRLGVRVRWIDH